jgi:hypothetical protein
MALAGLRLQITDAERLLAHPDQFLPRLVTAQASYPELADVIAFFRREADKVRLTTPFRDKVFTFPLDPTLRAMFGSRPPGIDWQEVVRKRQTVLLDYRGETDAEMRRFKLLWVFDYLYSWLKTHGRSALPFGLIIDEFAHLTQQIYSGTNPLAQELDELINVYMRANTIWFTAAHQELYQIDDQLRNTLLSLGTYLLGSTRSMGSARVLADALFLRDPYWVKHYRRIWARDFPWQPHCVLDLEPEFMLFAQRIKQLGRFQFLLRPALAEGHIGSAVLPLSIRHDDVDSETGTYHFPDPTLMARVRSALAARAGIPIATLLKEQEHRVQPAVQTAAGGGAGQHQPRQTRYQQADFHLRLPNASAAGTPGTPPTQRRRRIAHRTDGRP